MSKINKTMTGLSLALIIVGGGGLIYAQNPFQREAASKQLAKVIGEKNSGNLKEVYAEIAREATKIAVVALPTKTAEADEKEVILEEDFSLWIDGSEEELGAYVSSYIEDGDSSIDDALMHTPGWWGFGVMEAGGMAALAHPNFGGVLTTGPMELYGNVTVSFRLKAREENPAERSQTLIVSAISGDLYNPVPVCDYQIINITPEEGWQDYAINFLIGTKEEVRIQFNGAMCSPAGLLLDDIKIERDFNLCLEPTNLTGYGFDLNGFTAAWEPGAENNSYLLTVLEEVTVGKNDVEGTIDFNDAELPANLEVAFGEDDVVVETDGADGSRGLKMDNDDYFTLECGGGRIYGFSLFIKPYISDLSEYTEDYPSIKVEGYDVNGFVRYGYLDLIYIDKEGGILSLDTQRNFPYQFTKLRLSACDFLENDYCIIDNINYKATPETETITILDNETVAESSYRIDGLNPEGEYYFAVQGVKNEELKSERTPFYHALGLPTPVATEATDIEKRGAFTANWEPSAKAAGYVVTNYEHSVISQAVDNYVVINDNFENALTEEGYLDGTSFDGIADNNGWTTTAGAGLVSIGCIGSFQKPLYTPELSLGNDNGKFTVKMKIRAFPDKVVVVQSHNEYVTVDLWEIYYECDWNEMVEHEMEVTFNNGTEHERLMIYGADYGTILIENFTVTQNVKEGDVIFKFASAEQVGANDLSVRFSGLTNSPDFNYAYNVKAYGDFYGTIYGSKASDDILVDLNTTGLDEILASVSASRGIKAVKGGIEVTIPEAATITVYSLNGTIAATENCAAGTHTITLTPGIYAVNNGTTTTKVIVK